jgi:hypothetical protein
VDAVAALRELIEATGARSHVEGLIGALGAQALRALAAAPLADAQARRVLAGLAAALTGGDATA